MSKDSLEQFKDFKIPMCEESLLELGNTINKTLIRFICEKSVRNTILEDYHSGITPSSKTGDYSDVKVVTPYGEIPWNELSRISDPEMRELMLEVEDKMMTTFSHLIPYLILECWEGDTTFESILERIYENGVSWDDTKTGEYLEKNNTI